MSTWELLPILSSFHCSFSLSVMWLYIFNLVLAVCMCCNSFLHRHSTGVVLCHSAPHDMVAKCCGGWGGQCCLLVILNLYWSRISGIYCLWLSRLETNLSMGRIMLCCRVRCDLLHNPWTLPSNLWILSPVNPSAHDISGYLIHWY